MSDELKPCPFCGGTNLQINAEDIDGYMACVRCWDCDDMQGPASAYKYRDVEEAKADAIQQWNKRATAAELTRLRADVARKDEALIAIEGMSGVVENQTQAKGTEESMMDAAEMDRETLLKAYRDRVSNLESQVECLKRSRDKFRDQFTARKKHLDYLSERHNALAVKCDRLEKNQMPEGAVCFVPTGEVRCPKKGDSFKTAEGAFTTTDFDWPGMATSDNLDRAIYRRVEAQAAESPLPAKADGKREADADIAVKPGTSCLFCDCSHDGPAVVQLLPHDWTTSARYQVVRGYVVFGDFYSQYDADVFAAYLNGTSAVHQKLEAAEREIADLRKDREAWDAVKEYYLALDRAWVNNQWQASAPNIDGVIFGPRHADPIEAVLALKAQLEGK